MDFDQEMDELHTKDSFYIVKSEVNGDLYDSENDDDEVASLRFTYAETPEALTKRDFKQIKFWLYKADALVLARFIAKASQPVRKPPSPVN